MADYSNFLRGPGDAGGPFGSQDLPAGVCAAIADGGLAREVPERAARVRHPSSRVFGEVGQAHEAAIRKLAAENAVPVIRFARGDNREEIARPLPGGYRCVWQGQGRPGRRRAGLRGNRREFTHRSSAQEEGAVN